MAGKVSFRIELTTPACPVRDQLQAEAKKAVAGLAEWRVLKSRWDFP